MPLERATFRSRKLLIALAACLGAMIQAVSCDAFAEPLPRIAVLDPGHAEIIAALGAADLLVLVPDDPAFQNTLHDAIRYHRQPSLEGVLGAGTSLLVGGNPGRDRPLLERVASLGVETRMISRELPTIARIRAIAAVIGQPAKTKPLIADIEADYAQAARIAENGKPPIEILHLSSSGAGTSGAVTAAGRSTAAHGLIERAGGINVGARAGLERYQSLTAEGVMRMAPAAILVSDLELQALGGKRGIWDRVPGLANTPAARERRLIVLPHAAVKFDAAKSGEATLALALALEAR